MSDEVDPLNESDPIDYVEGFEREINDRKWLGAILPFIQSRSHKADPSPRVQFAIDLMQIAACERIRRILGSDLSETKE